VSDSRAAAPAVGKALEAGIVVLFVALLTTTLYGGVVPNARTAAADEVSERTLQHAAANVEAAVPERASAGADAGDVVAERHVSLPATIRGSDYRVTADGERLVLVHGHGDVGGETPLVLPESVRDVRGNWTDSDALVRVRTHSEGGYVVELAGAES